MVKLGCCLVPPSMRNRQSQFSAISIGGFRAEGALRRIASNDLCWVLFGPTFAHWAKLFRTTEHRGQKNRTRKKNKFLGTEVPRNSSDQCSLDFAYFLCLFSGRRSKSSQELCSWELFFLILGGFSPCENSAQTRCIVKGEAQKSPLFWRLSGAFDFLRSACSIGIPLENP